MAIGTGQGGDVATSACPFFELSNPKPQKHKP